MTVRERDCVVMGVFSGCLLLCFLMMVLPEKKTCEVSVMYQGGKVSVVRYGVVKTF